MLGLIFGLVLIVLGVIALIKDVLDLYIVVGLGFILIGAYMAVSPYSDRLRRA
jgi:drug/metabolite transporter (DMT)-like permease